MPNLQNSNMIEVPENEDLSTTRIKVEVSFASAWENCLVIRNETTRSDIFNANNFSNDFRVWKPAAPGIYSIRGFHKEGPPDPTKPWLPNAMNVRNEDLENRIPLTDFPSIGTVVEGQWERIIYEEPVAPEEKAIFGRVEVVLTE